MLGLLCDMKFFLRLMLVPPSSAQIILDRLAASRRITAFELGAVVAAPQAGRGSAALKGPPRSSPQPSIGPRYLMRDARTAVLRLTALICAAKRAAREAAALVVNTAIILHPVLRARARLCCQRFRLFCFTAPTGCRCGGPPS